MVIYEVTIFLSVQSHYLNFVTNKTDTNFETVLKRFHETLWQMDVLSSVDNIQLNGILSTLDSLWLQLTEHLKLTEICLFLVGCQVKNWLPNF